MISFRPGEAPNFGCTCENGYSGNKCEVVPGSTKAPFTTSSPTGSGGLTWKILDDDSDKEGVTVHGSPRGGSTDTADDRPTQTQKTMPTYTSDDPFSDNEQKSNASKSSTSVSPEVDNKSSTRSFWSTTCCRPPEKPK